MYGKLEKLPDFFGGVEHILFFLESAGVDSSRLFSMHFFINTHLCWNYVVAYDAAYCNAAVSNIMKALSTYVKGRNRKETKVSRDLLSNLQRERSKHSRSTVNRLPQQ